MTRETAFQILTKHLTNKTLIKHSLAVEAVMRALAPTFKADQDIWGITGLLHDADYEKTRGNPEKHGILLFDLEPNSIPSVIEHAIRAHNFMETKTNPESLLDWALYCCDDLTGFITELAESTKEKSFSGVTVDLIIKKLLDKNVIKEMKRGPVYLCEEKLGIPLEQFIAITLKAMQSIHESIEL